MKTYLIINDTLKAQSFPVNKNAEYYKSSKGLKTSEASSLLKEYGPNLTEIPLPSFIQLMIEHVFAPFFVFQLCSIFLMMLDDYLWSSTISLLSLFISEANTVRTRQSNLLELHQMKSPSGFIKVLRDGSWARISTEKLVPGDLVLLEGSGLSHADFLILSGRVLVNEAILTGESTPQLKFSFHEKYDKKNIVFGGTKILQVYPSRESQVYLNDEGSLGFVLSTGFGSTQGKLLRTILFSQQMISAESRDSMKLLFFLLGFALTASGYVVQFALKQTNMSPFRVILQAINILTSTIPPDLPMELTLSVNNSLLALSKLLVFCTEPFRIPFGGSVSVCCFDKTGTLTEEDYVFEKIELMGMDRNYEANLTVGGCHTLLRLGTLIGDSLEKAAFQALGFNFYQQKNIRNEIVSLSIQKVFHFNPEKRRMTTIVQTLQHSSRKRYYVLTKGAPEAIAELLETIPEEYFKTYQQYTRQGSRVLAMATKEIPFLSDANQDQLETNLQFSGFLIFSSQIKKGTKDTIVNLLRSTHRVILITGDHPFTALHVASSLGIIVPEDINYDNLTQNNICYSGNELHNLSETELFSVVKSCSIFARMSPSDKSLVIRALKSLGEYTMMTGDGTNDVDALKQAHVGIGLLEGDQSGAASIASPFVSKRPTISSCVDIIRFGRATLSSTMDLFKILSLSSLVSAVTKSVLFTYNVKFGDFQMTCVSILLACSFMALNWAKPLRNLSSQRPFQTQFNCYFVVTVLIQFAVHFAALFYIKSLVMNEGYTFEFNYKVVFSPNLMNSAMFLLINSMDISTFVANYRGRPFMESFYGNKLMFFSVILAGLLLLTLLFEVIPSFNTFMELVKFPNLSFQIKLGLTIFADFISVILIDKICLFFFTKEKKLVNQQLLTNLKDYQYQNDDVLPEESHKFGVIDMFKTNISLQKKMTLKLFQAKQQEEVASKLRKKK